MRIERNILQDVRNSDIDKSGVFNIPNSVKIIGACAFDDCSSLEKINYKNQILSVKSIDGDCMVIKSSKSLNDYQTYKTIYFDDYVRAEFEADTGVVLGEKRMTEAEYENAMELLASIGVPFTPDGTPLGIGWDD